MYSVDIESPRYPTRGNDADPARVAQLPRGGLSGYHTCDWRVPLGGSHGIARTSSQSYSQDLSARARDTDRIGSVYPLPRLAGNFCFGKPWQGGLPPARQLSSAPVGTRTVRLPSLAA